MSRAIKIVSTAPTPEGLAALEELRLLGFKLDSASGAHRLIRSDGSQAALYRQAGKHHLSGHLGNITDETRDSAAIKALPIAKTILADEEARRKLGNVKFGKALDSRPYG